MSNKVHQLHQFLIFNPKCKNPAYNFLRLSSSYYHKSSHTTTPENFNPLSWKLSLESFQPYVFESLLGLRLHSVFGHTGVMKMMFEKHAKLMCRRPVLL